MIDSIFQSGLAGMQSGYASAANHAEQISRGEGDLIEPIVGLKLDAVQVRASANVIKVGKELSDSILDIIA